MSHRPPTPPPPGFETIAAEILDNKRRRTFTEATFEMSAMLRRAKADQINTIYLSHDRWDKIRLAFGMQSQRRGNTRCFLYCEILFIQQPKSDVL